MSIVIYGAGGHGKIILEMMERSGIGPIAGFVDENPQLVGTKVDGVQVLCGLEKLGMMMRVHKIQRAVIAVGNNQGRRKLADHARGLGLRLLKVIHPTAIISHSAHVGEGTILMAGCVIGTHAKIGEACIINTRASVDHDCEIGDFVHIAPGVTVCGGAIICDSAFVGAGATVIPEIVIGDDAIVGAGATVIRNVASKTTVVGCPAREIKKAADAAPAGTEHPPAEQAAEQLPGEQPAEQLPATA